MTEIELIIKIAALIGALGVILGMIWKVIKWFLQQGKQTNDIKALRQLHERDMAETRQHEAEELQTLKDELCVLSYAVLATLDGLKQLGANGNVTKAHNTLEKHLNQQAHNQK